VIATTNRPDKIDPAVLRTGRIDKHVYVPLPDFEARREMFSLHLQGRPLGEIDYDKLAQMTEGYIASDISYVVNDASMTAAFNERLITGEALEETIQSVRPSLRPDVIVKYDKLREQMEGASRANAMRKIGF
jgi:transitional endoplasmic reticulum ATPase